MAILKEKVGLSADDVAKLRSMKPGLGLDMQVATPTAAKRVRTEFVGMDGPRFMIFKFPDETKWGSLSKSIYPDSNLIVRYILEDVTGEIIAFKCQVKFVINRPSHLIFASWPKAIQNHGLRSDKRAQAKIPAKIYDEENERFIQETTVLDISNSGCRIGMKRAGEGGQKIEEKKVTLRIDTPKRVPVNVSAEIMNFKTDETMSYYGIKFSDSTEDVEKLLDQLMITFD